MKMLPPLLASILVASACAATSIGASAAKAVKAAPLFKTSFDCAQAKASIEKLICHDPQLAQMDIELERLYLLVLTDDHSVPPRNKVEIDQQFWIDARNQCASGSDPKACTVRSYAERAHLLRQGSMIARTKDPSRLTEGPVAFRCAGFNGLIAASFFTVEPSVVYLKWANTSALLNQVPSSYETLYRGKDYKGSYSFRQNGNDAVIQIPGSAEMSCTTEPAS
ncbi:lysozyme inhibitor LprI family protein [Pseudomonas sp. PD9R]|uniref:lysozyme inhibitor LprI family protein n=1 Tax=Pseudomonas sp. PD9R TaxID=2853534 RepID=UPI001C467D38|nr:hypothetical protein [Pseudomonas sp. PD9R]MBV6823081.1 hypothetical protein [Pseudomonas sp. PD9R]